MHKFFAVAVMAIVSGVAGSPAPRATGKRGATWTWFNTNLNPSLLGANGEVKYMYNYETYQPATGKGNLEFIGMQGCYPTCDSSPASDLANRASQQGWTKVFSANEPDLAGHSPSDLVSWYRQYIEPLAIQKAYPAVTSSTNSGQGLDWLQSFINGCSGCYHDWINLHWYGNSFSEFQSHIQNAHSRFPNERIIVTEYALNAPATAAQQNAFFQQAVAFLDGLSYVDMHFPFVATSPALLTQYDSGAVSNVGTGSCLYNNDGSLSTVGLTIRG